MELSKIVFGSATIKCVFREMAKEYKQCFLSFFIIIFVADIIKIYKTMIELVDNYNNYLKEIPKLIRDSYYKAEYFLNYLNLSEATYYRKMRENAFTCKEVSIITELLFPEELILRNLKKSEDDIKEGRVETHKVVMDRLKLKYFS